ncbi:hypothetical protein BBP00_00007758 [Phytophthora kernoviae]|uniref:Autophagy-related protein 9 n=1 Tax=Phytophthora kernoviae TaxID=325452 RepID=A0A3F2RHX2_9STRA|nr:hypothetical protein BBP00_00007758 [Phytophthora kernoviae]
MDESLLAANDDHLHAEEEDELLWNELKDDHRAPPFGGPSRQDGVLGGHAIPQSPPGAPLPSLRVNVHLPAISTLFREVLDTAKAALPGAQARGNGQGEAPSTGRVSHVPDRYGNVANLDAFLITLYNYYYHKGFWSIMVVELVSLMTGLFSVLLSSFLLGCVQWGPLLDCHRHPEKGGCAQEMEQYISCRADNNGLLGLIGAFYFAMFSVYWLARAFQLIGTLRNTREMEVFYKERLHINERQVQTIAWDEVVTRVLDLVNGANMPANLRQLSSYKLQIDPALLSSPHDFARRIMRRDNYLIAFMNHALFQGKNLLPTSLQFLSTSQIMCSRNMEANLNICLLDQMFDTDLNLAPAVIHNVEMLKKRFVIAGVLNFVLAPFILLYRLSRFFFLAAQEWQTNHVYYFGTRRWSSYATWRFREYNELPHVLDARMECVSVLLAPYILCVSLPRLSREILLFLRSHSLVHPSTGAVCRFAEFDFKEYGNDAKMESSFINFKQNHPKWVGASEGEALMQRLGKLKEEEMEKSMRMGDTMMYSSHISMSQQLMQSQAIQTAMGGGRMSGYMPQDNEFYWLEKLHQQGRLSELDLEGMKGNPADSISISSLGSP